LKKLVVNADDFGFTHDVNEGIVRAHHHGILTATTLMAHGAAFDDAVRRAADVPDLDIGVHLTLVGAPRYPATVSDLLVAMARRRIDIAGELREQIEKVLAAGIRPRHLDAHKHTHLLPPVLRRVAELSREYGIPWVRRPFDFPLQAPGVPFSRRLLTRALGALSGRFYRVLQDYGCRTTDHFAGFRITGRYDTAELCALIRALPDGVTELMTHPGVCTDELRAAHTRLKESREKELEALVSTDVRRALADSGVELVRYRDLPKREEGPSEC
jgi:chitin disaccharide deacetylase